jgi:hypothetical protein
MLAHIQNRNQDAETVHSTQEPVECMRRPVVNNSSPGQAVYELFSDRRRQSSRAKEAHRIGYRTAGGLYRCAGHPWQNFTGKHATLDGDGRTFDGAEGGSVNGTLLREIAAIEAELLAGDPDVVGLVLALSDWNAEVIMLLIGHP